MNVLKRAHLYTKRLWFHHTSPILILNTYRASHGRKDTMKKDLKNGPDLKDFIASGVAIHQLINNDISIPYLKRNTEQTIRRKVFFYVYGCQMNVNDTEVVWSILKDNGYTKADNEVEADVLLVVTCAIRDSAEAKIWHRLDHLRGLKRKRALAENNIPVKIGVLGCMAERLKEKLLDKEKAIDIVAGPDSYRDLPRLLALTENNQHAVNVLLSLDETYADVIPVRLNQDSFTAFVSIMRGCDNMCTYCIVPFTRGKERSRPISSIVEEVRHLSEQGVKEITLLGQNVNSYRDLSVSMNVQTQSNIVKGFKTVYKPKEGGLRFVDLLEKVSAVDPNMRIRFTSAHPKDFPDELLGLIAERPNICKMLHLPAQSGSTSVLERMRRGYSREAYLNLVQNVRSRLPDVGISSDFISGFCGETEDEFQQTLSLLEIVNYNVAFLFPYSMRERTTAHRRYQDDVPEAVKRRRHLEMVKVFRERALTLNKAEIGKIHLVLAEGPSRRSNDQLCGRNDISVRVVLPQMEIPCLSESEGTKCISPGDYVAVQIVEATSQAMKGKPLYHTNVEDFYTRKNTEKYNEI